MPTNASGLAVNDEVNECLSEYAARANLYRLFAGVFVEEPSGEYLKNLRSPEVLASLTEMGATFDADFLEADIKKLEDDIACEYATMFNVAGGLPPVESVRRQGGYHQDSHFDVKKFYQENGFKVAKGRFVVMEDNLGIELQFAAALLDRAREALERGDTEEENRINKVLKRFWTLHLGRWVRGYSSLVLKATQHSFFREMANLLGDFAEMEVELMKLKVEDEDQGREHHPIPELPDEEGEGPVCGGGGPSIAR